MNQNPRQYQDRDGLGYMVVLKDGLEARQTEPGLYRVTFDERDRRLEVSRTDAVATRHAAVNGIQNDLDRAAFVMLDKVSATCELRREAPPTEFTLYHVPTRGTAHDVSLAGAEMARRTTEDARRLADVLGSADRAGERVVWSVHSRGAAVFDMAAHECARRGEKLPHTAVAIYNGAANEMVMNHDLRAAGIAKVGAGYFNYVADPVPQLIGSNTRDPIKVAASLANGSQMVSGGNSVHTWHPPLTQRDFDSVPLAQWEKPGIDLRTTPSPALAPDPKPAAEQKLDLATVRAAGIAENDPTFKVLAEAIGARKAYDRADAAEQIKLLGTCRLAFRRDVTGPELTGVMLRTHALDYVRGEASAATVLGAAVQHSTALRQQQALTHAAPLPDLGLGR